MPDDLGAVGQGIQYDIEWRRSDAGGQTCLVDAALLQRKPVGEDAHPAASQPRQIVGARAQPRRQHPVLNKEQGDSFFAAASCCARSQQKRVSLESNGSRDSINKYLGIDISLPAGR